MRKRELIILCSMIFAMTFSACKVSSDEGSVSPEIEVDENISSDAPIETPDDNIDDESQIIDENYLEVGGEIAIITDLTELMDNSFIQSIYEGVQEYAYSSGVNYSYYVPESDDSDAYTANLDKAIDNGAKLVICTSEHYYKDIISYQDKYPNIYFLLLEGVPKDASGKDAKLSDNVHCICFDEVAAGYLAGYISTVEGYEHFGFMGGEEISSVIKYGYGFVKGIDDAAVALENADSITINYTYTGTYLPSDEIEQLASDWYEDGTQVIFSCGGGMYTSVLEAAEENDALLIGVDTNQNDISPRFLTSAEKGIDIAVISALDEYFAYKKWPENLAGEAIEYGLSDWCPALPTNDETWRFNNVTDNDYMNIYMELKRDRSKVDIDTKHFPKTTVKVVKQRFGGIIK